MKTLYSLTIFIHSCFLTLLKTTCSALISMSLVHNTAALDFGFADILPVPPDGSLEEPRATIASKDAVMLPGRMISANLARDVVKNTTCKQS